MKELMGMNAGKVWAYLDEKGKRTLKQIRKDCKLTERDTYGALGWLAREGKVAFNELKDDFEVALIK